MYDYRKQLKLVFVMCDSQEEALNTFNKIKASLKQQSNSRIVKKELYSL